ncbi:MAG: YhfG family protein [Guyparkeria sp.]
MCHKLTQKQKARRILRNRQAHVVASFRLEGIELKPATSSSQRGERMTATEAEGQVQRLIAAHAR